MTESEASGPIDRNLKDEDLRARAGSLGMWLFLLALSMLFGASILGYGLIRFTGTSQASRGLIHLPIALYFSTAIIIISSFTFHRAIVSARQDHQRALRAWLATTLLLAIAFIAVQAPALWIVLRRHYVLRAQDIGIYGLIFFLILLHALHVIGGLVALVQVNRKAAVGAYQHRSIAPLRHAALYWHFLDIIWLAMFTILMLS